MYNQNSDRHKPLGAPISPRISFSGDFAAGPPSAVGVSYRDAPVSSDFEFSVTNQSMMSADELFCQGRLLPFQSNKKATTTIRDELMNGDDDDDDDDDGGGSSLPATKSLNRWKGFLGLRSSGVGSRKGDKGEGSVGRRSNLGLDQEVRPTKNLQEGSSSKDFEFPM